MPIDFPEERHCAVVLRLQRQTLAEWCAACWRPHSQKPTFLQSPAVICVSLLGCGLRSSPQSKFQEPSEAASMGRCLPAAILDASWGLVPGFIRAGLPLALSFSKVAFISVSLFLSSRAHLLCRHPLAQWF